MSALTDYFQSLANKIRTKTGKNNTLTPTDMINEIDTVYSTGQANPVTQTKSVTPTTSAQTVTPDAGKFLSSVSVGAISTQTKSATPTTTAQDITPDSGKYLTKVSVGAIATQTKSATPTTSAQTITPDSGKYLTSVSVAKIPNQAAGGAKYATTSAQTIVTAPKYITSNITLGALSQTNLAAANILRGKTITIKNGSANVWSVAGSSSVLVHTDASNHSGVKRTGTKTMQGKTVSYYRINPGFTPTILFAHSYDPNEVWFWRYDAAGNLTSLNSDGTTKTSLYLVGDTGLSSLSFTSSAVDILCSETTGNIKFVCYIFGY